MRYLALTTLKLFLLCSCTSQQSEVHDFKYKEKDTYQEFWLWVNNKFSEDLSSKEVWHKLFWEDDSKNKNTELTIPADSSELIVTTEYNLSLPLEKEKDTIAFRLLEIIADYNEPILSYTNISFKHEQDFSPIKIGETYAAEEDFSDIKVKDHNGSIVEYGYIRGRISQKKILYFDKKMLKREELYLFEEEKFKLFFVSEITYVK